MMDIKIQDVIFVMVLFLLLWLGRRRLFVAAGLCCFFVAIPLYSQWIFFTAQRLVMYGAFFMFISVIVSLINKKQ